MSLVFHGTDLKKSIVAAKLRHRSREVVPSNK